MIDLTTLLVAYLVFNSVFSGLVAYVASQKGRSGPGFFFLSFFLSFIVGILVVIALPHNDQRSATSPYSGRLSHRNGEALIKCPQCAEWIKSEAKICRHCGSNVEKTVEEVLQEASRNQQEAEYEIILQKQQNVREIELKRARRKPWILGSIVALIVVIVVASIIASVNRPGSYAAGASSEEIKDRWVETLSDCEIGSGELEVFAEDDVALWLTDTDWTWDMTVLKQKDGVAVTLWREDSTFIDGGYWGIDCFTERELGITMSDQTGDEALTKIDDMLSYEFEGSWATIYFGDVETLKENPFG